MIQCAGWLECFTLTKPHFLVGIFDFKCSREAQQWQRIWILDVAEASEAIWQATHETVRICECPFRPGGSRPKSELG